MARLRPALAIPAVADTALLAVMPLAPAGGQIWLPLCTGGDTYWHANPLDPGKTPPDDRHHSMCAHAACPRETKVARKPRRV